MLHSAAAAVLVTPPTLWKYYVCRPHSSLAHLTVINTSLNSFLEGGLDKFSCGHCIVAQRECVCVWWRLKEEGKWAITAMRHFSHPTVAALPTRPHYLLALKRNQRNIADNYVLDTSAHCCRLNGV